MGPCDVCARPGCFGAPHPTRKITIWVCSEHRAALPDRGDRNYERTEAEDRDAAMRYAAAHLSKAIGKDRVAEIGKDAFNKAFQHGLDAYFAMRRHQLDP